MTGGMPGDIEVQDAPTVVVDDEKAVQETEGKRGNREEVRGGDGFARITKKGPPTLGRLRISGCASHPAGDGSLRYLKPEHEEFAMNAWGAPGCVLRHHLEN